MIDSFNEPTSFYYNQTKQFLIWGIVLIIINVAITFGILYSLDKLSFSNNIQESESITESSSTEIKVGDIQKVSIPTELTMAIKAGEDTFKVNLPVNVNSGEIMIPVTGKIKKISKLIPSGGKSYVELEACSQFGCQRPHPVSLSSGEMIVAIDLEFVNTLTTVDPQGNKDSAYFSALNARFKVDNSYQSVSELVYAMSQWIEEEPYFYIQPLKKVDVTFWTRVPLDAKTIEFVYAKDFNNPIIRIPLTFDAVESSSATGQ